MNIFKIPAKKEYFKNDREITKLVHLLGDEDIVNFSLKYSEILRFTNSSQIVKRSNILQIYRVRTGHKCSSKHLYKLGLLTKHALLLPL